MIEYADYESELEVIRAFFHYEESRKIISSAFKGLFIGPDYKMSNGLIFEAIKALHMQCKPIDFLTVSDIVVPSVSPYDVTMALTEAPKHTHNIESLKARINKLKELFFMRYADGTALKIRELVNAREISKVISTSLNIEKAHRKLFTVEVANHFGTAVDVINSPDEYIPSSFAKLRNLVGGYSRKALSSIGGKSGHNKTTFSLCELIEQIKLGLVNKAVFISVDEPGEMIARRVIAKEMNISTKKMRNKEVKLNKEEVLNGVSKMFENKLIIIDNLRTPEEIQQAILDYKPDRTIVDHIQELNFKDNDGISESGITYSLKLFKDAAFRTGGNVLVLSQVRDKVIDERFTDKIPRPHDFYYASTMRQKCREQMVVYWKYKDSQEEVDMYMFDLIVWKSSYSETGRIRFIIDPEHANFVESGSFKKHIQQPESEDDIWKKL